MTRRINAAGLSLIKNFEGLRLTAYRDAVGVWTIGYGSTGNHVKPGMKITQAEAEKLLREDLDRFEKAVEKYITVPLNDNQFAALVSFSFNVGTEALRRSTLRKKLNAGNYGAVRHELMKWNKAGGRVLNGLTRRREAEGVMFRTPALNPAPQPAPPAPAKQAPAPQTPKPAPASPEAPQGWFRRLLAAFLGFFTKGSKP